MKNKMKIKVEHPRKALIHSLKLGDVMFWTLVILFSLTKLVDAGFVKTLYQVTQ